MWCSTQAKEAKVKPRPPYEAFEETNLNYECLQTSFLVMIQGLQHRGGEHRLLSPSHVAVGVVSQLV